MVYRWPFLMGFGVTGFLIFKVAAGITGVKCIKCCLLKSPVL